MHIEPPKFRTSHPDRDLQCQESIEGVMQEIIANANMNGWGTVETMNAMKEVLRNLRLTYADANTEDAEGESDYGSVNDDPLRLDDKG